MRSRPPKPAGRSPRSWTAERGESVIDDALAVAHVHAELMAFCRRSGRPRGAHDLLGQARSGAAPGGAVAVGRVGA